MTLLDIDELPLPQSLAVRHSQGSYRNALAAFLSYDQRLARFVSQANEPMLAQMRIAWWRDQLSSPVAERRTGDPVLDAISEFWAGEEAALLALADGWEALLAENPLPASALVQFVEGRAGCFAAIAVIAGQSSLVDSASSAGAIWAYADLAANMQDEMERQHVVEAAQERLDPTLKLPRSLKGLSILYQLGKRSLDNGGGPLISNRSDIFIVSRIGLFGM